MVVCTSRVVKIKKHLPFCKEFRIFVLNIVVADHVA